MVRERSGTWDASGRIGCREEDRGKDDILGETITGAVVPLDGLMADDNDGVGPLFDRYENGVVTGERDADVAGGQIGDQALKLGLIDEVVVNRVAGALRLWPPVLRHGVWPSR